MRLPAVFRWSAALRWLVILAALALAYLSLRECRQIADAVVGQREPLVEVARRLSDRLVGIRAARGDELLVAEIDSVLEVRQTDTRREFWTGISLGTSEAVVRAPVRYRYQIRLGDGWELLRSGEVLVVVAPPVLPVQPPAIDTAGLELHAANGWARFNAGELRDRVLRDLTGEAAARAGTPAYLEAAREPARAAVGRFARDWIAPRGATVPSLVVVRFRGESLPDLTAVERATIPRSRP